MYICKLLYYIPTRVVKRSVMYQISTTDYEYNATTYISTVICVLDTFEIIDFFTRYVFNIDLLKHYIHDLGSMIRLFAILYTKYHNILNCLASVLLQVKSDLM